MMADCPEALQLKSFQILMSCLKVVLVLESVLFEHLISDNNLVKLANHQVAIFLKLKSGECEALNRRRKMLQWDIWRAVSSKYSIMEVQKSKLEHLFDICPLLLLQFSVLSKTLNYHNRIHFKIPCYHTKNDPFRSKMVVKMCWQNVTG